MRTRGIETAGIGRERRRNHFLVQANQKQDDPPQHRLEVKRQIPQTRFVGIFILSHWIQRFPVRANSPLIAQKSHQPESGHTQHPVWVHAQETPCPNLRKFAGISSRYLPAADAWRDCERLHCRPLCRQRPQSGPLLRDWAGLTIQPTGADRISRFVAPA